jgi:integrase
MPRPDLPYVQTQNARGRTVYYFRRNRQSPRIRLPGKKYSSEFMAAYQAALAGQPVTKLEKSYGKLSWLIDLYRNSEHWKSGIKASSRVPRGRVYDRWADLGWDVAHVTRQKIVESMAAKDTVGGANAILDALRPLFAWAVEAGHVKSNPCDGVKKRKAPKSDDPDAEEGFFTWTDGDLKAFEDAYPIGTHERLAYEIILNTGLRISDAARVGLQHVQKDGSIRLRCKKNRVEVHIPMLERLKAAIAAGPRGKPGVLAFLTGKRGRAMTEKYASTWFNDAARGIGLVDKTCHGIRKATACRWAERPGATEQALMAIFGWTDPAIAHHYIAMANRKRLATNLMLADGPVQVLRPSAIPSHIIA